MMLLNGIIEQFEIFKIASKMYSRLYFDFIINYWIYINIIDINMIFCKESGRKYFSIIII